MIVLDSNVYVSALNFPGSKPHQLLQMAVDREVEVAISEAILLEVLRVLRLKFHATPEDLEQAESIIVGCTHHVVPSEYVAVSRRIPTTTGCLNVPSRRAQT